jgi:putative transposase
VLEVLHSDRLVDMAPAEIYATLLDEGQYLASVSSMYRILRAADEVKERRHQATHSARVKPELVATSPNQVWSWDITKLHGPAKWTCFHLYVIIDIYSRQVVGWMVAGRESSALAERLLADTIRKHRVDRDQLTIHADNGSSMASKPVALLLADLGVTKSRSRPHVSNDTPYSEAQFKTIKYRPDFPSQFGSPEDARGFCQRFFDWSTTPIATRGSAFTPPPISTTGGSSPAGPSVPRSWQPPMPPIPSAFSASPLSPRDSPTPPGSTAPLRRSPDHRLSPLRLSQTP